MALIVETDGELPQAAAMVIALAITSVFMVIVDEIEKAMREDCNRREALKALRCQIDLAIDHLRQGL